MKTYRNIKSAFAFHVFSLVFMSLICLFCSAAQAFVGKDKLVPLAFDVKMTKEEFEAKADLIKDIPFKDESLAFEVRLPQKWIKLDSDVGKGDFGADIFKQLAVYVSPPSLERQSMFRVRSIEMNALMAADDWFINYMLDMGFSIEGIKIVSRRRIEAQYTLFDRGEPISVRAVAEISGKKMILAEFLVHQDNYKAQHEMQIWTMQTFSMPTPDLSSPIPLKSSSFVDIAKFEYPETWLLYAPSIRTIDRMETSVINVKGGIQATKGRNVNFESLQLDGRIDVLLVSKTLGTTLLQEVKLLNTGLRKKKLKLGKFIENVKDVPLHPKITDGRIDVYEIESEDKRLAGYEYWIAVMQTEGRYYLVRLLTIGRGENFETWAQNAETYRVLLSSISPYADTGR